MAFNKVTYRGQVVIDLTDSTVRPETLGKDIVAYDANGERIVGVGGGGGSGSSGGIIEVDELPTENIDINAFYLYNGEFYRYIPDEVWMFNETLNFDDLSEWSRNAMTFYLTNGSGDRKGIVFDGILYTANAGYNRVDYKTADGIKEVRAYDVINNTWYDEEFRLITITTKPSVSNVIKWLKANAIHLPEYSGWQKYSADIGSTEIAENGTYDVSEYAEVVVKVPVPSGSTEITENGTYDVADFEEAVVNVPVPAGGGIIEVDELPVEDINLDAFYLYNGEYYKGTNTWLFNEELNLDGLETEKIYSAKFTNNTDSAKEFVGFKYRIIQDYGWTIPSLYLMSNATQYSQFYQHYPDPTYSRWLVKYPALVTFAEMPTDETFLEWLKVNATLQPEWIKYTDLPNVISVDELPEEKNVDFTALYFYNGEYYKGVYNTYVFNDVIDEDGLMNFHRFDFKTPLNGATWRGMVFGQGFQYTAASGHKATAYNNGEWKDDVYKTITILSPPEDNTLAWIKANATAQFSWEKYILPKGSITLTENGTYDVTNYAECVVSQLAVVKVDTLPTENIDANTLYECDGIYYKSEETFSDLVTFDGETVVSAMEGAAEAGLTITRNTIPTRTDDVLISDGESTLHLYYIIDEANVGIYGGPVLGWLTGEVLFGAPVGGVITDKSEVTVEGTVYILVSREWKRYADGPVVITVDELPTENIDVNVIYKCGDMLYQRVEGKFSDMIAVDLVDDVLTPISLKEVSVSQGAEISFNIIPTRTTDSILTSNGETIMHFYYIEDEQNVAIYLGPEAGWVLIEEMLGIPPVIISNASEAIDGGLYAVLTTGKWIAYSNGSFVITVEELPTENIDTSSIYKCGNICYEPTYNCTGAYVIGEDGLHNLEEGLFLEIHYVKTKPTSNILEYDRGATLKHVYYVDDANDLMCYVEGTWFSYLRDGLESDMRISGKVSDVSELVGKPVGSLWVVLEKDWAPYTKAVGNVEITKNGTYDVAIKETVSVEVPSTIVATGSVPHTSYFPVGTTCICLNGTYDSPDTFIPMLDTPEWFESAEYVWTDGTYAYYSKGDNQYRWDVFKWKPITFDINLDGDHVWTDGTNIYHSDYHSNKQYVFNRNTYEWEPKTWNILIGANGIWTDGTNIYYSGSDYRTQYVLNGDIWERIEWKGMTAPNASNIWTDGTNIYYSHMIGNEQYVLNGDTWEPKTWNIAGVDGRDIWTDGTNVYFTTSNNKDYVLNGDTWKNKYWYGVVSSAGVKWTVGTNVFMFRSDLKRNYALLPSNTTVCVNDDNEWIYISKPK